MFIKPANAQITGADLGVRDSVGSIDSIYTALTFVYNLFVVLGWAGVILGVGFAIFGAIYKQISSDSEEALPIFRGYVTKSVMIVVTGIILLSAGFIVKVVGDLTGTDVVLEVPSVFK